MKNYHKEGTTGCEAFATALGSGLDVSCLCEVSLRDIHVLGTGGGTNKGSLSRGVVWAE